MSKDEVTKDEALEDLEPENADEIKGGAPTVEGQIDKVGRVLGVVKRRTPQPE